MQQHGAGALPQEAAQETWVPVGDNVAEGPHGLTPNLAFHREKEKEGRGEVSDTLVAWIVKERGRHLFIVGAGEAVERRHQARSRVHHGVDGSRCCRCSRPLCLRVVRVAIVDYEGPGLIQPAGCHVRQHPARLSLTGSSPFFLLLLLVIIMIVVVVVVVMVRVESSEQHAKDPMVQQNLPWGTGRAGVMP